MDEKITGGCLCGTVRYEADELPNEVYVCHCRYCQRHTGSAFWVGAKFANNVFRYTQEEPKRFQSSTILERYFCSDCGSTVALFYIDPPWADWSPGIEVAVGSLDQPAQVTPTFHYGVESQLHWLHFDDSIPQLRCDEDIELKNAFEHAQKSRS